jgi:hypothetical protein
MVWPELLVLMGSINDLEGKVSGKKVVVAGNELRDVAKC